MADSPAGPETSHNDQLGGGYTGAGGGYTGDGGGVILEPEGAGGGGQCRERQTE